jgi:hypothetical protein
VLLRCRPKRKLSAAEAGFIFSISGAGLMPRISASWEFETTECSKQAPNHELWHSCCISDPEKKQTSCEVVHKIKHQKNTSDHSKTYILVGGLEHFSHNNHNIWDNPSQLAFIFFKMVKLPPTRYITTSEKHSLVCPSLWQTYKKLLKMTQSK